jgi:hypothetical protein
MLRNSVRRKCEAAGSYVVSDGTNLEKKRAIEAESSSSWFGTATALIAAQTGCQRQTS